MAVHAPGIAVGRLLPDIIVFPFGSASVLGVENLTITSPARTLISNARFSLAAGGHVGLIGHNSGGKTSLLHTIQALWVHGRPECTIWEL